MQNPFFTHFQDPQLLGSSTSTVNSGGGVSMNLEGGGRGRKEKLLRERMRKYEWAIRMDRQVPKKTRYYLLFPHTIVRYFVPGSPG